MFWSFGSLYLLGLQVASCLTFAWSRWLKPELAEGSGFWIAGAVTLILGISGLVLETVALFWTTSGSSPRWWGCILRSIAFVGVTAVAGWGLYPFIQAAVQNLIQLGHP